MDPDRLLARRLDGRLDPDAARALDAWCAADPARAARSRALDALHADLTTLGRRQRGDAAADRRFADRRFAERILAALPATPPARAIQFSLNHLVAASTVGVLVALVFAALSFQRDLLPLGIITVGAVLCGLALMVLARPLRRVEAGMMERLLARRVLVTGGDVLVVRAAGFALVLGGLWLAWA